MLFNLLFSNRDAFIRKPRVYTCQNKRIRLFMQILFV